MMEKGIFARTFTRPSVDEVFQAVRKNGFSQVQFSFISAGLEALPDAVPNELIEDIKLAKKQHQIEIHGLSGTFNMIHPDPLVRSEGLKKLRILARAAPAIGTQLISLCSGSRNLHNQWEHHPENNSPEAWQDLQGLLDQALLIAEEYDIFLGIEPEMGNVINSIPKAQRLLKEMKSNRLKIILDPANLFTIASQAQIKALLKTAIDRLGHAIFMTHAKDRDASGNFVAPGQGLVPFAFFVEELQKAGLYVPMVAHGFPAEEVPAVSKFLDQIL